MSIKSNISNKLQSVAYTTPGTYSWICPAGVYTVIVEGVGGGGGGGGTGNATINGATNRGASGGAAAIRTIMALDVSPGTSYSVVVGAGGAGAPYGCYANGPTTHGSPGGTSYFGGVPISKGGNGGISVRVSETDIRGGQSVLEPTFPASSLDGESFIVIAPGSGGHGYPNGGANNGGISENGFYGPTIGANTSRGGGGGGSSFYGVGGAPGTDGQSGFSAPSTSYGAGGGGAGGNPVATYYGGSGAGGYLKITY